MDPKTWPNTGIGRINPDGSEGSCSACHSPTGRGNGPAGYPALGGQHADYIAAQLKAFRMSEDLGTGGRSNDGDTKMMRDLAIRLTDGEIEAVASYIAGLH